MMERLEKKMKTKNTMKKYIALLLTAALCIPMTACGAKSGGKEPAAADVVGAVTETITFQDTMDYVGEKQFSNIYRIDLEKVADKSMYAGSRASAEEVTVIRMKDAADVQLAKDAIEEHLADQKAAFETYIPEEMAKIESAQTFVSGAYVMLVVADDFSGAEAAFQKQF